MTPKPTISVKVTRNYGNEAIYPVCQSAQYFAQLVGTKTLTRQTLELIKKLGYEIVVLAPTI